MPTTSAGYPYVDGSELVKNWPAALQALAVAVGDMPIPRFTDATARNSAFGSSTNGRFAYLTSTSQLTMCDGTGWVILAEPPQTWSPTFSGITVASPTITGYYHRSDGWCDFAAKYLMGGTPSVVSSVTLTLPVTATGVEANELRVSYTDNGGFRYPGFHDPGATTILLYAQNASGTYVSNNGGLSTTVPFTWGVNDYIAVQGRFRMSSRYA